MPETDALESSANLPGTQESQESDSSSTTEEELPFGVLSDEGEAGEPGKTSGDAPADDAGEMEKLRDRLTKMDADYARSRQEIANYKQHMLNLGPVIEAGMKAQGQNAAPVPSKGDANQPLTAADQNAFLSKVEEIVERKVSQTWDQKNYNARQMERLEKRANSELDGFDKMREHPTYVDMVNAAVWFQSDDRGTLKKQDEDETFSAMKYAHSWFLASNPDYMKAVKETGKKEALAKAKQKAVAESSGGTPRSADVGGEREANAEQKDMIDILKSYRSGRRELPSAR
jgi:hypothetical protein